MSNNSYMAEKNANKARYWTATLYPENMVEDWETLIGDIVQLPYAYCIHDKDHLAQYKPGKTSSKLDKETDRKVHVHIILAFANTTTRNSAHSTFMKLAAEGRQPIAENGKIEAVSNIRHAYEYLIHNTETARKKQKKYQYDPKERITGNNFDIGAYEQVSVADKDRMARELCNIIRDNEFSNFMDFYDYVDNNLGMEYFEIIKTYSGLFERLTKGNFQKIDLNRRAQEMAYHMAKDMARSMVHGNTKNDKNRQK